MYLVSHGPNELGRLCLKMECHTHSQRGCVWKEEEKKHLTPALGKEWEEGNVFFSGSIVRVLHKMVLFVNITIMKLIVEATILQ